jgi:hypothetical protein
VPLMHGLRGWHALTEYRTSQPWVRKEVGAFLCRPRNCERVDTYYCGAGDMGVPWASSSRNQSATRFARTSSKGERVPSHTIALVILIESHESLRSARSLSPNNYCRRRDEEERRTKMLTRRKD